MGTGKIYATIYRSVNLINLLFLLNWQAQTEELAVFKKCSTPVIYKSSASLAVNKLRKESIG